MDVYTIYVYTYIHVPSLPASNDTEQPHVNRTAPDAFTNSTASNATTAARSLQRFPLRSSRRLRPLEGQEAPWLLSGSNWEA